MVLVKEVVMEMVVMEVEQWIDPVMVEEQHIAVEDGEEDNDIVPIYLLY